MSSPDGPRMQQIERVEKISRDEFLRTYVAAQKPVVMTRIAEDWPSHNKWSMAWLKQTFGHHKVRVNSGGVEHDRFIPLGQWVDEILDGRAKSYQYLANFSIENIPAMKDDIDLSWKLPSASVVVPQLYMGAPDSGVGWHTDNRGLFDWTGNTAYNVVGRKRWRVASPTQDKYLYAPPYHPSIEHRGRRSPVNHLNPDLGLFPLYARAEIFETVLEPGEVLYLPSGWWHSTLVFEGGFSVNWWWSGSRVIDVALHTHSEVIDYGLGDRNQPPLGLSDLEEFGGVAKFSEAWRPGLEVGDRRYLLQQLTPEARQAVDSFRASRGLPALDAIIY